MQNSSPAHRFQRTRSPRINKNYESPKPSKNDNFSNEVHYARSEQVSPQTTESLEQAEGKISNLSLLLRDEKQKRQTQFSELYKMIHSIKKDRNRNKQPQFSYDEYEFPMTPRAGNKQDSRSRQNSYATYTPIIETVPKSKNKFVDRHDYYPTPVQELPLRSIEMLMLNIQRDAEFNNRNISRIQEQILSLRLAMSRSRETTTKGYEIPQQIQKYVRDGIASVKKCVEIDKKSLYKDIQDIISLKLQQRMRCTAPNFKDKSLNAELQQIHDKIENINTCLGKQIKAVEDKLQCKVLVVNDIVQSKFNFFKDSLVDQILKDRKKDLSKVELSLETQRKRINELEDTNEQFYQELEKTMQNLQNKLRLIKPLEIQIQKWKQDWQQFKSSVQQNKPLSELQQKLTLQIRKIKETDIKQLQLRVQRLQDLGATSSIKLTKNNSINSDKTMTPEMTQMTPKTNHEANQNSQSDQNEFCQTDQSRQISQLLVLFSQNCSFLQGRNCSIEQSIEDIILVINDLVAQIRPLL